MEIGLQSPVVSGVSPNEGPPGTRLTIRGENLGDSLKDIMGVSPSVTLNPAYVILCALMMCRHQDWWAEL